MAKRRLPQLSHVGIFAWDIDRLERFYSTVFGLTATDRGVSPSFGHQLIFMSANAEQHHQLVISSGRAPGGQSTIMQLSFMVDSLAELREIRRRSLDNGASAMIALNHGNAWSIYFDDPEQNKVEVYLDTPFHVAQPCGKPLDLSLSDAEVLAQTEATARTLPGFMPREDYIAQRAAELGL